MFWLILMILMLAIIALLGWYLTNRIGKFSRMQRLTKRKRILLSLGLLLLCALILVLWLGIMDMLVCMIHLGLIWSLCDFIGCFYYRLTKKEKKGYVAGYVAILITLIWMGIGWYCVHHVFETYYTLETDKALPGGNLRVVEISDAHTDAVFRAKQWPEYVAQVNATNPDMILLVGDIFDDGTSYEEMLLSCEAFASFQSTYGTYYVFGNHDRGYGFGRGYGEEEIINALEANHVTVLQDDVVSPDGLFNLVGCEDKSRPRKAVAELFVELDTTKYTLVMDHQPSLYDTYAAFGMDLVLSGHTHGGQFFPIQKAGEWMGVNDATYGLETRQHTSFIVSSGIADWELHFKTGCVSEIVIIDIQSAR